ncbi:MAG: PEP-CTERM sorting domain-containing protein [Acidobacteria bacterium]|nr:PEP-CTERM sorting domain-containing protein [Acidobacteriota bacterium]
MKRLTRSCLAVLVMGCLPASAGAATITFASGAGIDWTSTNTAVCGGSASCSGTTTAITPHGLWQPNDPDGSGAVWVSYADTGITGTLAPINQVGPLMSFVYTLDTIAGTTINFRIWADDTAGVFFNGVQVKAPNFTQNICADGPIGCEPNESAVFAWTATGNDVIRFDVYQVGTGTTPASNPFGVLFHGSYETVPEPALTMLVGLGFLGLAAARRRFHR